ncbi:MAG: hypothetical protein WAT66_09215 [Actinomycetota bacterium]
MRRRTLISTSIVAAALLAVLALPAGAAGALTLKPADVAWKKIAQPALPSWATWDLHRKVVAAGPKGLAIPTSTDVPASSLAFLGIRPGQLLVLFSADGTTISLCTSNFIFSNGSQFFVGMAGHCGLPGDDVDMLFLPGGLVNIGKVVMSTGDAGVGNDFGLISIDPSLNQWVSPSMAYWGGPTGAYAGTGPAVVEHAGWGAVIGTGGTPRVGLGITWTNREWRFEGLITPGDSGSAANVLGGLAAGNITHITVDLTIAAGTSIQKILQLAGGYQLQTCSQAIPWPLPGCP